MFFFDTECCGFHGPLVLIQWQLDDGEIQLFHAWERTVRENLDFLECMATQDVVGFNLAFDWFHIQKWYNMMEALQKVYGDAAIPYECVDMLAEIESRARFGSCIKPKGALDLMLHARKGPYQSTMDRKEVRLRRVPKLLSEVVIHELEDKIRLDPIYFKPGSMNNWKVHPVKDAETGLDDPDFVDIVLKFSSSTALKAIVKHAGLRDDTRILFTDFEDLTKPIEAAWAPWATAIAQGPYWVGQVGEKKGVAWPGLVIKHHNFWKHNELAIQYARDDVEDTYNVYKHFSEPEINDDDSILACMVGSIRWRGYSIDVNKIEGLQVEATEKAKQAPIAPAQVFNYLSEVMTDQELEALRDPNTEKMSTKKVILQGIEDWVKDCQCVTFTEKEVEGKIKGFGGTSVKIEKTRHTDKDCKICSGKGSIPHPASERATLSLVARQETTKKALYNKLLQAGRLHPAASVIGSLSGRMSGRTEVSGGKRVSSINALGIQHEKTVRQAFTLADGDLILHGGDFDAFEISIADAAWDDAGLRKQLLSCNECNHKYTPNEFRTLDACPSCGCSYTSCKTCRGQVVVKKVNLLKIDQNLETGEILSKQTPGTKIVKPCGCSNCDPWPGGEGTFRKIHALFAMELNPGKSYNDIISTKGQNPDLYDDGKRSLFGGVMYGGDASTISRRVGYPEEVAAAARTNFFQRYEGVQRAQDRCYESFCSMRQPGGIGKKVEWNDPKEYVESLTGFRRYFTLENEITKALFDMAENPPKSWMQLKVKVRRRDRDQYAGGAVKSALYAAAFQIQAQCMRAALNHEIQSTGASITKALQVEIWNLQPIGTHEWIVQPMNIHDEVMCPSHESVRDELKTIVNSFIEKYKSLIPLIKIDWKFDLPNWAGK